MTAAAAALLATAPRASERAGCGPGRRCATAPPAAVELRLASRAAKTGSADAVALSPAAVNLEDHKAISKAADLAAAIRLF